MEIQFVETLRRLWKNRRSQRRAKAKADIRELTAQRRRIMTKEEVAEASEKVMSQLESMDIFQNASVIMMYYPIHNEVDIRPLLDKYADSKTILLPVVHRSSIEMRRYTDHDCLHRGKFGIPEPRDGRYDGRPNLIIVPGVAFDRECNRLGRGKGFYDRFLRRYRRVASIGLAYDKQVVAKIPTEWHDRKLSHVVTQTTIY